MTLPPGPRAPDPDLRARPTYLDVDLAAIRHNVARLAAVAGAPVCAVVKADGYGHGAVEVARAAVEAGAQWLAVALVEEGRQLRDAGLRTPILLFSEPPVTAIGALLDAELTPCVYRPAFIAALDAAALARQRDDGDGDDDLHDLHDHDDHDDHLDQRVAVHVKADTGMGRVGAPPEQWDAVLQQVASARGLRVDGLFTHLACADDTSPTGDETTRAQLAAYDRFLAAAARAGIDARWYHVANTAGLLRHPDARRGLVRPGIGVYGLSPDVEVDAADHGLRPALRVVSEVSYAKRVAAGTPVSYGHRWRAPPTGGSPPCRSGTPTGCPGR